MVGVSAAAATGVRNKKNNASSRKKSHKSSADLFSVEDLQNHEKKDENLTEEERKLKEAKELFRKHGISFDDQDILEGIYTNVLNLQFFFSGQYAAGSCVLFYVCKHFEFVRMVVSFSSCFFFSFTCFF